jgi:hypothetical protein
MDDEKTRSRVEGAIERLNQDPYLLATISAVPVVGSSITQVLTGIGQQIVQERNKRLFEQLSKYLATVDERAITKDYFETPEGFDLLIKALDESRRTRSDEKRDLIAQILQGALVDYGHGEYSPEEYLYLISDLTVQELGVARLLYEDRPQIEADSWNAWEEKACQIFGIDKEDLYMTLDRLSASGLLTPIDATDEGDFVRFYTRHEGGGVFWAVSAAFEKLVRFLELDAIS